MPKTIKRSETIEILVKMRITYDTPEARGAAIRMAIEQAPDISVYGESGAWGRYTIDPGRARVVEPSKPTVSPMALLKSHPWFVQELDVDTLHDTFCVELSIMHRSNRVGLKDSAGWGDPLKIMVTPDHITDKASLTFYRSLAQVLCDHLNASKVLTKEARRLSHMDLTP